MSGKSAAGRKTELVGVSGRLQELIEDQVASLTRGVADCVERARTVPSVNAYEDNRSSERRDAVGFVSATAGLLEAIAKLKGEFNQNYHVTRVTQPPESRALPRAGVEDAQILSPDEMDSLSDEELAERMLAAPPPPAGNCGSNET